MTKHSLDTNFSVIRRIAVLGGAKTGKSSLISRFLGQPFEELHNPTVEDYHVGKFYVGETLYHMELTDTSGTFEFPAMERLTMEKADSFIFVYSLDDKLSFERVKSGLKRLSEIKDIEKIPIIVVCNKADLANIVSLRNMQLRLDNGDAPVQCLLHPEQTAVVSKEQLLCAQLEYVRELGCEFLLTSAKFRWNVNRIFQQLFAERKTVTEEKKCDSPISAFKFKMKRKKTALRAKSI